MQFLTVEHCTALHVHHALLIQSMLSSFTADGAVQVSCMTSYHIQTVEGCC